MYFIIIDQARIIQNFFVLRKILKALGLTHDSLPLTKEYLDEEPDDDKIISDLTAIRSFNIYENLSSGSFDQRDVETIKRYERTQCIGDKDNVEINILKVFEAGYLLPDYNKKNKDEKTQIKDLFFNSFLYSNTNDKIDGEKSKLKEQIDYFNKNLSSLSLNNTEKIMYKNLLELSYNFIGIDTTLTNIDKYSHSDFYVKYRILLFDYYIKKKNKQNNTDNLYNNIKDMIESKKNVMISDYKNNKTSL